MNDQQTNNERVVFAVTSPIFKDGELVSPVYATAWHKGYNAFVSERKWQVTKLGTNGKIYAEGIEEDTMAAAEKAAEIMEGKKIGVKLI